MGYVKNNNLSEWVNNVPKNSNISKNDYWVRDIYSYSPISELSYASGASKLKGYSNFNLSRDGDYMVNVKGTVYMNWSDDYDWHDGASFCIPRVGSVKDDDANYLRDYGGAKEFRMESTWEIDFEGTFDLKNKEWKES